MTRVVIDTNVLLRYLIKPNPVLRQLVEEEWLGGKLQLVTAPELLTELEQVLARDSMRTWIRPEEGRALLDAVRFTAEMLPALGEIPTYTRDPKDDKFIAGALAGGAEYVITLDQDILVIGALGKVQMVTPLTFIKRREGEG